MNYYSDYISHHGIEGQKWGIKNGPPYPLEKKDNKKKKNKNYNQSQNDEEIDDIEEGKRKAMRTGKPELIQKYAEDMTAAELSEALRKMDLMEQLKNSDPSRNSVSKLDNAINKLDKFNRVSDNSIKAYNTLAALSNAIFGTEFEKVDNRSNNNQKRRNSYEQAANNQRSDEINYYDFDDYIDGDYREVSSERSDKKKKKRK